MSNEIAEHSSTEFIDTASDYLVGGGILTMALFPLAIPMIALLAVVALPLLLIAVVPALIGAVLAVPVLLLRALWRTSLPSLGRMRHDRSAPRAREWLTDG
jgi:hypothetical protein